MANKLNDINFDGKNIDEVNSSSDLDLYTESVKEYIRVLVSEQTCPNCWASLFDWMCENLDTCWYWHWDEFLDKQKQKEEDILDKKEKLSLSQKWNWKKYKLSTIWAKSFNFYNYYWRIEKEKANIQIEIDWVKLKMNLVYSIEEKDDIKQINNIRFIGKVKKYKSWSWQEVFINYRDLKKYVITILLDTRFNLHL